MKPWKLICSKLFQKNKKLVPNEEQEDDTIAYKNPKNIDLTRPRIYQIDDNQIRCFSHFIAISEDKKSINNHSDTIFTLPSNDEDFFKELVIDPTHKCIWGITQNQSYQVFRNNSITEFNTTKYQKDID